MIAKASAGKAWTRAVASLLFAGFGLFLWLAPGGDAGVKGFGIAVVVFFAGFALWCLRSAFDKGEVLTIDDLGVLDRRVTDRPVPWSEIAGMTELVLNRQPFFYLDVGDGVTRFTDHGGKKAFLLANQGHARGVMINPHGLDVPIDRIRAELQARLGARQAAGMP